MRRTLLLADDEEYVLTLVTATLGKDRRYRVLVARDGEEALRLARQERPELLFLDIVMPKLNGYQVCRELKGDASTAHIKIVMLTALAQEADRQKALDVCADGYLTKPFSPSELARMVNDLLAPRQGVA